MIEGLKRRLMDVEAEEAEGRTTTLLSLFPPSEITCIPHLHLLLPMSRCHCHSERLKSVAAAPTATATSRAAMVDVFSLFLLCISVV